MKPPERESGGMVSQTAASVKPPTAKSKDVDPSEGVKVDLEDLARAYVVAADAEHAAKLARLEARDRLIECAPIGFESEGVRVQKRNCWKLSEEAVAEMTAVRAALIEEGKAELIPSIIAVRIGRETE